MRTSLFLVTIQCLLPIGTARAQMLRVDFDDDPYIAAKDTQGALDTRGDKPARDPDNNCRIIFGGCPGDGWGQAPWPDDTLLNFRGEIAPGWFVSYPGWINTSNNDQAHYEIHRDADVKTQGTASMRIETTDEPDSLDSQAIEDIYLARPFPTVPGAEYAVTFDLRLSDMRWPCLPPLPSSTDPWIMFAVLRDGSLDANDIVDIEDRSDPNDAEFPCFVRPDTLHIPPENVDEQWHTYLTTFTAEATQATFVLYIRNWCTPDDLVQPNYLDNLVVERLPWFASSAVRDTGQTGGCTIDATTYQGVRFHVDDETQIKKIGGHLESNGEIFGAIVPISGPSGFPQSPPFDPSVVPLVVTLSPGSPSDDVRVPYEVVLEPGDYAVVFGSGAHGASGTGAMPTNNVDLGTPGYIEWNGTQWTESAATGKRFIVTGRVVFSAPAISMDGLAVLGVTLLVAGGVLARRGRRADRPSA